MRQLPSESIDLIYIDPPFFSNRNYNVIWGDKNEERSFNDIWEGGLDGYLIWLNARLYEMKRLLKPTGSIYVHCDWHASHYIKVEMDNIFGYENFRNEVAWCYDTAGRTKKRWNRKHDVIFYYVKSDSAVFNEMRIPRMNRTEGWESWYPLVDEDGRRYQIDGKGYIYYADEGRLANDWWDDIRALHPNQDKTERIGYPTQKPELLIERIIRASSSEGGVVADFFGGGGGTGAVAQRLGRRWIVCDQSRVAIAVTAERLKNAAQSRGLNDPEIPDFTIEHWGVYEASKLSEATDEEFHQFVLDCYGNCTPSGDEGIHAYQGSNPRLPVWVGRASLRSRVSAEDVVAFANAIQRLPEYRDGPLQSGIMLAWGFARDARAQAETLASEGKTAIELIQLQQVTLESGEFRKHIAALSTERGDYSEFLTFVRPPNVRVEIKRLGPRNYQFDATATKASNADAKIINIQWDFDYNEGKFVAAPGEWFQKTKNKNAVPSLVVQHVFPGARKRIRIACRIQDDKGGEGMWQKLIDVE